MDDLTNRLTINIKRHLQIKQERMSWHTQKLAIYSPGNHCKQLKDKLDITNHNLFNYCSNLIDNKKINLRDITNALDLLNPTAILSRGYSITRTIPEKNVVRDAASVAKGQQLEILLDKGLLNVKAE
jgi:exodeoxyribonuclease VII large subunit